MVNVITGPDRLNFLSKIKVETELPTVTFYRDKSSHLVQQWWSSDGFWTCHCLFRSTSSSSGAGRLPPERLSSSLQIGPIQCRIPMIRFGFNLFIVASNLL